MKLPFKKLNQLGVSHILVPLVAIVVIGGIGSYVAVKSQSHAAAGPSPAFCAANGLVYQNGKCVPIKRVVFSTSGGSYNLYSAYNNHTGYHAFKAGFDVSYGITCAKELPNPHSSIQVGAGTQYSTSYWFLRTYEGSTTSTKTYSATVHSSVARTLQFSFSGSGCKYSLSVAQ